MYYEDLEYFFLLVNNWELYQKLLDHLLARHIKTSAEQHPIMMTEPPVSLVITVSPGSLPNPLPTATVLYHVTNV